MKILQICLVLCYLVSVGIGYRILGAFPLNGKSHHIVFEALMKGLAKKGHQVDMITHFTLKKPMKNYNVVVNLAGSMETFVNNITIEFASQLSGDMVAPLATTYGNRLCDFLGFEEIQKIIKNPPTDPPYDLVITEAFGAHCYMGLGYVFKVPVVAVMSTMEYSWVTHFIGNSDNLAFVPNIYLIGAGNMNFWQRLKNVLIYYSSLYRFHSLTEESQTESMRKYLSPDIPNIREVEKNVALTLVNSHPVLYGVKPITPSLVQIAGLHVESNDEVLPKELDKWMNESTHGVICFTMGSMILIETLPKEKLEEIYESFRKISPIRVLMKIADASKLPPGLPKNVKISPWIPQQAVLAHPKIKLFITHGGLGGTQEALYYGVPMIGIPIFNDQSKNVEVFVAKQMMIKIAFDELSGKSLDSALQEMLQNPIYKEKSMHYSKLFRSRPISPMDNAIYWIEYIIQNGPDSLRSPALQFSWWQLALLDVYGFIMLVIVASVIPIVISIKFIVAKLLRKLKNPKPDNKKTR